MTAPMHNLAILSSSTLVHPSCIMHHSHALSERSHLQAGGRLDAFDDGQLGGDDTRHAHEPACAQCAAQLRQQPLLPRAVLEVLRAVVRVADRRVVHGTQHLRATHRSRSWWLVEHSGDALSTVPNALRREATRPLFRAMLRSVGELTRATGCTLSLSLSLSVSVRRWGHDAPRGRCRSPAGPAWWLETRTPPRVSPRPTARAPPLEYAVPVAQHN